MKSKQINTIFAIIIILPRLEAFPDSAPSSIDQKMQTQTTMAASGSLNARKQMSCFVCSTMDYENPQENSCKSMPKLARQASGPLHQPQASSGHHPSSMSFAHQQQPTTSTTSTTTTSTTVPSTPAASIAAALDGGDLYSAAGQPMLGSSTQYDEATQFDPATSAANSDQQKQQLSPNRSSTMLFHQQQQHSSSSLLASGSNFPNQQHRLPQNTVIRKRPCLEDENFCSIVSVVRIEFVNDTLVQRFWAMERNCSRSCNTGCMLIGERVRLRVCSQCCRTPDCNIGSGTTTLHQLERNYFHSGNNLLVLLLFLILLKLNSQPKEYK